MKLTTKKEVALKSGKVIAEGSEFEATFNRENPSSCLVKFEGLDAFNTTSERVAKLANEMQLIDFCDLEEVAMDSICPSLLGYDVEPDGWDEEGSPSWLLALGLI